MKRLWTPGWIVRHVAMVVLVGAFLALGWWQVSRAAAGNAISWGYAIEWPVFAGFVVFVWWREVRQALRLTSTDEPPAVAEARPTGSDAGAATRPEVRRPVRVARVPAATAGPDDPDLAEYNRYLRWLNDNPGARPGDYPG
ncbi:hypothetical protein ACTMSW_25570 [Micromonospora sp. BQ11]|uniref:hypothetical protein n=1 Tax=Micromonospora sp. BQ11 TaxID=3452212 RepID=UPI003F8946B0